MSTIKEKINDILLYSFSFISLILITILLSSSKNISYNIDDIKKDTVTIEKNKIAKLRQNPINEIDRVRERIIKESIENGEKKSLAKKDEYSEPKKIINERSGINIEKRYHIVKKGDTLWRISRRYNIDIEKLIRINKIRNTHLLRIGERIYLSDNIIQKKRGYKRIVTKKIYESKKNKFEWPLRGKITSEFGVRRSPYSKKMEFHTGIDIGAPVGKKISAAESGKVIFSGTKGGYGITIIIRHKNGYKTLYGHCLISYVRNGSYVRKGQIIGRVGMTGITTGPHIHFEIRKNNIAIDPFSLINKRYLYY